jgi:hypothetical protein
MFQYPSYFMTMHELILLKLSRITFALVMRDTGTSAILTRYESLRL